MIYLIASNSYHLIDDEINKIVGNKEYQNIDFNKTTLEEIITEANYTDLFSSEKILVIKNATFFQGKGIDTKVLEDYLEHPNDLTTLIFTSLPTISSPFLITSPRLTSRRTEA